MSLVKCGAPVGILRGCRGGRSAGGGRTPSGGSVRPFLERGSPDTASTIVLEPSKIGSNCTDGDRPL